MSQHIKRAPGVDMVLFASDLWWLSLMCVCGDLNRIFDSITSKNGVGAIWVIFWGELINYYPSVCDIFPYILRDCALLY